MKVKRLIQCLLVLTLLLGAIGSVVRPLAPDQVHLTAMQRSETLTMALTLEQALPLSRGGVDSLRVGWNS